MVSYSVELVREGVLGTLFFGASKVNEQKLEKILNKKASEGWVMKFMVIESRRLLLFWSRETVIITFERTL